MNKFAERLVSLRDTHNTTQQELADYLNLSRNTVAGYESKYREPDFDTTIRIADYFGVTVDYLLGRDDIVSEFANSTVQEQRMMIEFRGMLRRYGN